MIRVIPVNPSSYNLFTINSRWGAAEGTADKAFWLMNSSKRLHHARNESSLFRAAKTINHGLLPNP